MAYILKPVTTVNEIMVMWVSLTTPLVECMAKVK